MTRTFDKNSTADEVLEGIDLTGKRALVTGGASGLGEETVRALAAKGAEVIIAARNKAKADAVIASVSESTGNSNISFLALELGSLKKIEASAKEFLDRYDSLDLLINNAGVMACPFDKTEDGFELQFGSNHIGHFYFTNLIMPTLLKSGNARIVSLSSMGHRASPIVFDDINYENRPYEKWQAYGQAKTANALFAVGLNNRFAAKGIEAFSVHPGVILTPLSRHLTQEDIDRIASSSNQNDDSDNPENADQSGVKTVAQGAATSCYAATAPELSGKGGAYLENCNIAEVLPGNSAETHGVRDFAIDPDAAEKLWQASENMVGQQFS